MNSLRIILGHREQYCFFSMPCQHHDIFNWKCSIFEKTWNSCTQFNPAFSLYVIQARRWNAYYLIHEQECFIRYKKSQGWSLRDFLPLIALHVCTLKGNIHSGAKWFNLLNIQHLMAHMNISPQISHQSHSWNSAKLIALVYSGLKRSTFIE